MGSPPPPQSRTRPSAACCAAGDACDEEVNFVVRNAGHTARIKRRVLTEEVSPVLRALIVDPGEEARLPPGERDAYGRYILEGPVDLSAFQFLVDCVRKGGRMGRSEMEKSLPDLNSRLEACRNVDYYLLPGQIKTELTKLLLWSFVRPLDAAPEALDASKLGLCRSEMIMDRIHLGGLDLRGLVLENSHVRQIIINRCKLTDCEFGLSVTACEVQISRSRLERVKLGIFATKVTLEDCTELVQCNTRVVEELVVRDSVMTRCTFQGSDEDRKDRQVVSATFTESEIHGDVRLPFDKIVCEQTVFHGERLHMTKGGASITLGKTQVRSLPIMESESQVQLCLEDCDITEVIVFNRMKLNLRNVRFVKPCEFCDVTFVDKVCDIDFPKKSKFVQARFAHGMHACIASGCEFDSCNLGYGQDALSDCLLTQCTFRTCHFPFLESDSPVANLSGCDFIACRIQWSGPFAHEESFVINSFWLRKWNLAGSTVNDGL